MLDFVFQVDEMPREADKFRALDASIVNGGNAANSAIAVARLGGETMLAARIGDDIVADLVLAGLQREGIDTQLVRRFASHRSSFSSIYVDRQGERQIMNFRDMSLSMEPGWLVDAIPDGLDAVMSETRWPAGAETAMRAARKQNIPGVMDVEAPVAGNEAALALSSHVAFSATAAREFSGERTLDQALRYAGKHLPGKVMVTDGSKGVLVLEGEDIHTYPAFPVDAVDTLGAGDTWHGALALRLGEGAELTEAIRFSNAAAAIKCTRVGGSAGAPTRREVQNFLETQS